jgi:hypothetical protein
VRKQLKYILKQVSLTYEWLFDELTRPIEILSSVSMLLFSINLLLNNTELLKLPSYSSFKYVTPPELWLIFILISICQFFATAIPTIKANKSSGYFLMVSGAVWAWIAITFTMADTVVLTTAPQMYWVLAIFCSLAGKRLLDKNKELESADAVKGKNRDEVC